MELERIALSDPYFVQRKLYPNVDFYSGIVQRHRHPDLAVHGHLRAGPHGGLDRPVERNAVGPRLQDRPSPPAVHRLGHARRASDGQALILPRLRRQTRPLWRVCFGRPGSGACAWRRFSGGPGMAGAVRSDGERVNTNSKAYAFWQNPPKQRGRKAPCGSTQAAASSIRQQPASGRGSGRGQPQSRKDSAARRRQPCRGN